MAKLRKSWRKKLADDKDMPRVIEITDTRSKRWGTGTCIYVIGDYAEGYGG